MDITEPDELKRDHLQVIHLLGVVEDLFVSRNRKYKSAFKQEGAIGNAFMFKFKATRMMAKIQDWIQYTEDPVAYINGYGQPPESPNPDDVYDMLNYGVFLAMCIEEGNWKGTEDEEDILEGGEASCTCRISEQCPYHLEVWPQ